MRPAKRFYADPPVSTLPSTEPFPSIVDTTYPKGGGWKPFQSVQGGSPGPDAELLPYAWRAPTWSWPESASTKAFGKIRDARKDKEEAECKAEQVYFTDTLSKEDYERICWTARTDDIARELLAINMNNYTWARMRFLVGCARHITHGKGGWHSLYFAQNKPLKPYRSLAEAAKDFVDILNTVLPPRVQNEFVDVVVDKTETFGVVRYCDRSNRRIQTHQIVMMDKLRDFSEGAVQSFQMVPAHEALTLGDRDSSVLTVGRTNQTVMHRGALFTGKFYKNPRLPIPMDEHPLWMQVMTCLFGSCNYEDGLARGVVLRRVRHPRERIALHSARRAYLDPTIHTRRMDVVRIAEISSLFACITVLLHAVDSCPTLF